MDNFPPYSSYVATLTIQESAAKQARYFICVSGYENMGP